MGAFDSFQMWTDYRVVKANHEMKLNYPITAEDQTP